jgi:hypothetical protein
VALPGGHNRLFDALRLIVKLIARLACLMMCRGSAARALLTEPSPLASLIGLDALQVFAPRAIAPVTLLDDRANGAPIAGSEPCLFRRAFLNAADDIERGMECFVVLGLRRDIGL